MDLIQIYIDEDAIYGALVTALRERGVTVFTALESGLTGKLDEEQLAFATQQQCDLYTFNVSDFSRLHSEWIGSGREHSGIILAPQCVSPLASSCAAFSVFGPRPVSRV